MQNSFAVVVCGDGVATRQGAKGFQDVSEAGQDEIV